MAQFNRIYKLLVGVEGKDGIIIEKKANEEALNIAFNIDKDLTNETNKCSIQLYNISDETEKKIERDDSVCTLSVGYAEDIGIRRIFVGEVTSAWSHQDGPDYVIELELGDGQVAIRDTTVNLGYEKGVSLKKVVDDIAAEMGLALFVAENVKFSTYSEGFSFSGFGKDCLDKVCKKDKLNWSIQNNQLQIINDGGTTKMQAVVLSPTTGLIGSPEKVIEARKKVKKKNADKSKVAENDTSSNAAKIKYRLHCLINPTLNPGDLVKVESKVFTGFLKIGKLNHHGELDSTDWYTEIEGIEIPGKEETKNDGQKQ